MKTLAISYLAFVIIDWLLLIIGNYMDVIDNDAFDCLSEVYLFVEDNGGVIFSLFHGLYF
jgi:hypothetical protein